MSISVGELGSLNYHDIDASVVAFVCLLPVDRRHHNAVSF